MVRAIVHNVAFLCCSVLSFWNEWWSTRSVYTIKTDMNLSGLQFPSHDSLDSFGIKSLPLSLVHTNRWYLHQDKLNKTFKQTSISKT